MGTFKDLTDEQLQVLGARLIRNLQKDIGRQIPRAGNNPANPYQTGNLQRSLQFTWEKNGEGAYELGVRYDDYGYFTAFGSIDYRDRDAEYDGFFGRSFIGYNFDRQEGKKGIRPQYWLGLRDDQPVYEAIIEAELKMTWEEYLGNTIAGFKKGELK